MKLYAISFAIIFAAISVVITLARLFKYLSVSYPHLFQGYSLAYVLAFLAAAFLALVVVLRES